MGVRNLPLRVKRAPGKVPRIYPWQSTKDYEIESTDRQIDMLVSPVGMIYEPYGLTEDEL